MCDDFNQIFVQIYNLQRFNIFHIPFLGITNYNGYSINMAIRDRPIDLMILKTIKDI